MLDYNKCTEALSYKITLLELNALVLLVFSANFPCRAQEKSPTFHQLIH